jgi:hypothetical protein
LKIFAKKKKTLKLKNINFQIEHKCTLENNKIILFQKLRILKHNYKDFYVDLNKNKNKKLVN